MVEYKVGDVIEYSPFGGGVRRLEVTDKVADVKNGEPGFDGVSPDDDNGYWGYDSQVLRVVKRS